MTWVEKLQLVVEDAAVTADKVENDMEDMATPQQELCHARHQKSGPARTSKDTYSPLALGTRARMGICSTLLWRRGEVHWCKVWPQS